MRRQNRGRSTETSDKSRPLGGHTRHETAKIGRLMAAHASKHLQFACLLMTFARLLTHYDPLSTGCPKVARILELPLLRSPDGADAHPDGCVSRDQLKVVLTSACHLRLIILRADTTLRSDPS